ncbi:protein SCO1/2 [Marininema mesophilum]|uniref:Protein SCO1/2 n=1 Tax=Marininema mesophilum TaxID=1048340 RepID=A0A1H2S2A6_9BACL|nr:SCO family protein [Marininema mesophilum]SDW25767.1 protein SCO1/2 [Marininema mesophilum]
MRQHNRYIIVMMAIIFLLSMVLTGCAMGGEQKDEKVSSTPKKQQPLGWKVPYFTYTDQDGKSFDSKKLAGKPYLVDMIFTRCPDVCPPMTANMVRLQKQMKEKGLEVDIVSFSVDPAYDKPKKLKEFAKSHDADLNRWHFLTGYKQKEIEEFALKGFKSTVMKPKKPSKGSPMMVNHPVSFFLIDGNGKVYERYDGMKPAYNQILNDLGKLQGK